MEIGSTQSPRCADEVLEGQDSPRRADRPRDLLAQLAAVEGVAPAVGEPMECGGQQRLAECRACLAGRPEHGRRRLVEEGQARGDGAGVDRRQLVALLGDLCRGCECIGEGTPAEAVKEGAPGVDRSGDIDRQWPAIGHGGVPGGAHGLDGQPAGSPAAAVVAEEPALARIPDEGEGIAAETAGVAVDDRQHRVGRDRGVDGRPAGAQGLDAGFGGEGVRGDDHARRHRRHRSRKKRAT